nr:unnamed protein product [Spirometra erinaceieuropaei]
MKDSTFKLKMNQQPISVKLTIPQKVGFPGHANVYQAFPAQAGPGGHVIFQQKPQEFNQMSVPSLLTSSAVQLNTNTAVQYARKPQEMTIVGPGGTFMASPLTQSFGQVVGLNQSTMPGMAAMPNLMGPNVALSAPSNMSSLTNPRKPCNCTKSHCLKLYCECFAQGQLCQNCNCNNCMNNLAYEEERGRAIKMTLERNPMAFHPKIGRGEGERKHTKGCNCKRSGCLKNYCECYEAKISCSDLCRCQGCRNTEDSIERRSLMRLAAMGSLRSRQPNAFKKHLIKPPPETLPHVFFTWETIEATASCLLAQAEDAERRDLPPASQERLILEEFGRAVDRVIEAASKAQVRPRTSQMPGSGVGATGLPEDMTVGSSRGPMGSASAGGTGGMLHGDDDDDGDMLRDLDHDDPDDLLDEEDVDEDDEDIDDDRDLLRSSRERHSQHHSHHRHQRGEEMGRSMSGVRHPHQRVPPMLDDTMDDEEEDDDNRATGGNSMIRSHRMPSVKFISRGRHYAPHSGSGSARKGANVPPPPI